MSCDEKSKEITKKIIELGDEQPWNHNIELPGGIETSPGEQVSHGKNLVKWKRIETILDLLYISGKRVLDIGCNEGFFSQKIADKGAIVIGADIDELRIKKAKFVQSVLENPRVTHRILDIYSKEFGELDSFDLCVCMGFIHRVPDPYSAIAAISKKADTILFEWKVLKHGHHDDTYAYFSSKSVDIDDYYGTEFWLLSYATMESILKRLDFKYFYRVDDPKQRRGLLVAGKFENALFSQSDVISHRGRVPAFLSHTKRYLKTLVNIMNGRLNS